MYLYSYATTAEAARRAAKEVIEAVKPYKLSYPIAFDIEYESIYTGGSKQVNTDICKAFLDEIEAAGYYAMLYCSKDFLDTYLYPSQLTAYDKWIAQYASACTSKHAHGIWQYTSTGRVDGILGNIDRNLSYKDYPAILTGMKEANSQKDNLPYTVRCGSFPSTAQANTLKEKISKKGYFCFLSGSSGASVVCVGKFATQAEAQKTADDLKKKGFSGFVTTI